MLVKKVKLTEIGEIISYPKKENGNIVKTADGKDVLGYRRQVLFESLDFRKEFRSGIKGMSFGIGNIEITETHIF